MAYLQTHPINMCTLQADIQTENMMYGRSHNVSSLQINITSETYDRALLFHHAHPNPAGKFSEKSSAEESILTI